MRKSILTLGIAAVLTGVLATCSMAYAADDELAQVQESGKLKVGVEGTYPPYTYHDDNGELTGFDVEVAKAIADKRKQISQNLTGIPFLQELTVDVLIQLSMQ